MLSFLFFISLFGRWALSCVRLFRIEPGAEPTATADYIFLYYCLFYSLYNVVSRQIPPGELAEAWCQRL